MLSVIIIAKNEAMNIRRCLDSVRWACEIIVLDSGSDDNTVDIAREYTEHVYSTDWQGYGVQKQRALTYASQTWVLNLDADEWVNDLLRDEILQVISSNTKDAYRVRIQQSFYGKLLRFSLSPSRHIRLFKRNQAAYSADLVHEKINLPATSQIGQLQHSITHHCYQDVSEALYKMNLYSSYSAKIRLQSGRSASLLTALLASQWMFWRCYLFQCGFLDGRDGFLLAIMTAQGAFYRKIKQLYPDS